MIGKNILDDKYESPNNEMSLNNLPYYHFTSPYNNYHIALYITITKHKDDHLAPYMGSVTIILTFPTITTLILTIPKHQYEHLTFTLFYHSHKTVSISIN